MGPRELFKYTAVTASFAGLALAAHYVGWFLPALIVTCIVAEFALGFVVAAWVANDWRAAISFVRSRAGL